jgi:Fe-S oxidoreductase
MFGPELMQAFREFKMLWDPDNRMNPGKLIDAVRVYDPIENLRTDTGGESPLEVETHFAFAADGSFEHATERCVGVGACRKTVGGVMCPSYRATMEERHSTRGRARLLAEMLSGVLRAEGFQSEAVHEALDLCLSCKACKSECPVQVDMAAWKSEFLAQHYKGKSHPLQHYVFGYADKLAKWGSLAPALTNAILSGPLTSSLVKSIAGVAPQRELPLLAARPYVKSRKPSAANAQVVLWPDTWNNYYHPQTLAAADRILQAAGFQVRVPRGHICCGRPLYDFGFLTDARAYLQRILQNLAPEIDSGLPIVFLEPSCASVFRDELRNFFPTDQRAQRLRDQTFLLSSFLVQHAPDYRPPDLSGRYVLLHGHCHHKSLMKMTSEVEILRRTGAEVSLLDSGCCGMAGPFGFEKEKFAVSQTLAERVLLPAVRASSPETILISDGFSCREQIAQNSVRRAVHFAEALLLPPTD